MIWYGIGMVLVWYWYGIGMVLVWYWYGIGMVLVWYWYGIGMVGYGTNSGFPKAILDMMLHTCLSLTLKGLRAYLIRAWERNDELLDFGVPYEPGFSSWFGGYKYGFSGNDMSVAIVVAMCLFP